MSLSKIMPIQGLARTALLFVLALILIVIFFVGFSQYFIPLLLTIIVVALIYFTGMARTTPPWQIMVFILATFGMGYFIQRMTLIRMQTVGEEVPMTTEFWGSAIILVLFLFIFAYVAMKGKKGKMFKRGF